jgi:ATP-dependent DNA helicase 2 subunit 2
MTLKKVIASQVAKPLPPSLLEAASQSQSQGYSAPTQKIGAVIASTPGIEADVQPYTKYVVTTSKQATAGDDTMDVDGDQGDVEEREVDKDNLVKAYKFGSTWVPLNDADFEDMLSLPGMDVLGFLPKSRVGVFDTSLATRAMASS